MQQPTTNPVTYFSAMLAQALLKASLDCREQKFHGPAAARVIRAELQACGVDAWELPTATWMLIGRIEQLMCEPEELCATLMNEYQHMLESGN